MLDVMVPVRYQLIAININGAQDNRVRNIIFLLFYTYYYFLLSHILHQHVCFS